MTKFKAVVFDWAGTMIDFGSFAPVAAFVQAFAEFGIVAEVSDARAPMGMAKRDHIRAMLARDGISSQWRERHGALPREADVDALYGTFVPLNETVVANHADLVPGALEMLADLRARRLKIGSTTGYTRSVMERVLPLAAAQGYAPDCLVCSDDLPETRPGPLGMMRCFEELGIEAPTSVIKIDDTEPGIAEGVAAGCLTVGVTLSGNFSGMTAVDLESLSVREVCKIRERGGACLKEVGADHVIDTVADLPGLIDRLENTAVVD
jgi:phosphonoacetaldehyde hydrolase